MTPAPMRKDDERREVLEREYRAHHAAAKKAREEAEKAEAKAKAKGKAKGGK